MKILNLYAGVGGNRMLWGNQHEITAVELNKSVADCYKSLYPNDTVIVADAHKYLLDHYKEFDFIWSSPPCQTHSRTRAMCTWKGQNEACYPDMTLWQEIIFMKHFNKCNYVIENIKPYYKTFIQPQFEMGGHLYWSNKTILTSTTTNYRAHNANINELEQFKQIDLSGFKFDGISKKQVLRNMVEPEDGKYIFEMITVEQ
jgi:DNA (cytosine-5)-methyltransferase 1